METDTLESSLRQYQSQLLQVNEALKVTAKGNEFNSLINLKSDLQELIDLTQENLDTIALKNERIAQGKQFDEDSGSSTNSFTKVEKTNDPFDDEYALFMSEISKADDGNKNESTNENVKQVSTEDSQNADVNIEEELSSLEGMKCSALYCPNWGGAPSLHNAMVCSVVRDNEDGHSNFYDIKVRVMFTNPTHKEMVPCPYYLDGDCKFEDEQCRFSHGEICLLSSLSEAIEPNFSLLKTGSRVLAKLKQVDEPTSSKQSEVYLVWHRGVVKSVDSEKNTCEIKLEHDTSMKNKNKSYHVVDFCNIFPLSDSSNSESDSDSSSADTQNPYEEDMDKPSTSTGSRLVEQSMMNNPGAVKLGDWEKHTKGIGSKLMLNMGYVAGTGLGPQGSGRIQPVPCRLVPLGRSLDHCMKIREHSETEDPFKVEKKLRRLQKKQEEREKKAYERAKEKEQHDVFNILNDVLSGTGDTKSKPKNGHNNLENFTFGQPKMKAEKVTDVKSSTCKNLNIEHFKIAENIKRLEKDVIKLTSTMNRNDKGSSVYNGVLLQINLKTKEIEELKARQTNVTAEQGFRKDKRKMTVF